MRLTRLALVVALVLGAVGATGAAQDIQKADPSWAYMQVASSLTVAIKKNGVAMASLNFLPGTLVAVSDGNPVAGRRDFQGTFELRALPVAEAKAGAAATMMNAAPFILKVDGVEAHVENHR